MAQDTLGIMPGTIAEAAQRIRTRTLSPVELTQALLDRIEIVDPLINAFLTVTGDLALAQAREAEREIMAGQYRGPLHGIPIGLKDIYQTAGIRTTGHSKAFEHHVPREDAAAYQRLREAGCTLMGKLATHELAHGGPSFDLPWLPARNPWNIEHYIGGSSSGSAAAVASGLVLGAMGSDTGGSIRAPASLAGLCGIKPTFGLISRRGVIPNSFSLDHCGPIARTAEDCALMMSAIVGYDARDRSSVKRDTEDFAAQLRIDLKGVRIGVLRHFWQRDVPANATLAAATEASIRVLRELGAHIEDAHIRPVQDYYDVWNLIEEPETFSIHRDKLTTRPHDFGSVFLERTLLALLIESADYVRAQQARARFIDELKPVQEKFDVLLTAGAGPAPRLSNSLAVWPGPNGFVPFALLGVPALVCCAGFSADGLPMSIQLVGRPFEDAKLLGFAHAYERATGWSTKRAPLEGREKPAPIPYQAPNINVSTLDAKMLARCTQAAAHAGVPLSDAQLAVLCSNAPQLFEMVARVRASVDGWHDPASVFCR